MLTEIQQAIRQFADELTADWKDIPSEIAEATLVELVVKVTERYGSHVTLHELAGLLGMLDALAEADDVGVGV